MEEAEKLLTDRFLDHLRLERNLSPHTITSYRRDLACLTKFCEDNGLSCWKDIKTHHMRRFAAHSHAHGLHPRSIQRRLSGARSFINYLIRENIQGIRHNPASDISAPRAARKLPDTLDVEQMGRLLAIEGDSPEIVRDRAILELFYSSGLRLGELVSLDPADINLDDATVRVTGKGRKTRIVPVGRKARTAIREWLNSRPKLAAIEETALFVGVRGRRISPRTIQSRVRHWAIKSGLPQHVYPHLFRHSFATHLLESSGDLRGVQELLGHADISTTQVYTHLDFQHLAQIYDKAHPRARRKDKSG
jgi:integrase/recombinase XerC